MSIPTAVIPVVLHLLLLAHSAQTLQVLPDCRDSRALPSYIREPLFVQVDVAKRQNPSMKQQRNQKSKCVLAVWKKPDSKIFLTILDKLNKLDDTTKYALLGVGAFMLLIILCCIYRICCGGESDAEAEAEII
ncbi:hypothetical protein NECAME_16498 [Necator americanus]|uniref:Uncharacterized protein n=1 Tax=Necator americanus TaxID=51031 RepID=W2TYG8_NECAM|nr:hypothetical protein NECAME_16498 [Necator americanus]ETN86072.1 hypothetical protein NECAME_16498 [Necator americanus]